MSNLEYENSDLEYEKKYLKYKTKYLNLRNISIEGGTTSYKSGIYFVFKKNTNSWNNQTPNSSMYISFNEVIKEGQVKNNVWYYKLGDEEIKNINNTNNNINISEFINKKTKTKNYNHISVPVLKKNSLNNISICNDNEKSINEFIKKCIDKINNIRHNYIINECSKIKNIDTESCNLLKEDRESIRNTTAMKITDWYVIVGKYDNSDKQDRNFNPSYISTVVPTKSS